MLCAHVITNAHTREIPHPGRRRGVMRRGRKIVPEYQVGMRMALSLVALQIVRVHRAEIAIHKVDDEIFHGRKADVSRHTGGDLRAALGRIKAKTFVMPMFV
jgi:hypothetical protein